MTRLTVCKDVFTDHNAIIHHDAQREQKGEQRNHIQGFTRPEQHNAGAKQGYWNPQCHPECQPQFQEDCQDNEDQGQALQTVNTQQLNTVTHVDCGILPGHQAIARRQIRRGDILVHFVTDSQQVLFSRPVNREHHRRMTVDQIDRRIVSEAVLNGGDLAHG